MGGWCLCYKILVINWKILMLDMGYHLKSYYLGRVQRPPQTTQTIVIVLFVLFAHQNYAVRLLLKTQYTWLQKSSWNRSETLSGGEKSSVLFSSGEPWIPCAHWCCNGIKVGGNQLLSDYTWGLLHRRGVIPGTVKVFMAADVIGLWENLPSLLC